MYLFGSVARGDAGPDSDYDLLVIVPDDAPAELRRSRLAYEVLRGTGTAADVLVCTTSYFESRRCLKASLPGTVLREGRLLHASWHDVPFRKTHNLEELGHLCVALDNTLAELVSKAPPLTEYAWKFRYPGEPAEHDRGEAEEALLVAREMNGAIRQRISAYAQP